MAGSPSSLASVVRRLAESPAVAAVVLVGSRVSGTAEAGSDYDIFVYTDADLGEERARVAAAFADPAAWRSVREQSFGDGDIWRLKDGGPWLDLMYWSTAWGEDQLRRVLAEHVASMGYSTAFWRSIRDAEPLYERDGWHADLQLRARQPYPETLRRNIVALNRPYLRDHPFSYREQAAKALARGDAVSVNHRVAAWLASYFDILLAVNRTLHPGEKRVLEAVDRECPLAPSALATTVERLVCLNNTSASSVVAAVPPLLDIMDELADGLDVLLRREGLLPD